MALKQRILELLRSAGGDFVSGEQLSESLGVSRTAIWKHIRALREEGYVFEAVSHRGYRLEQEPNRLTAAALIANLSTNVLGRQLTLFDEVDSTQNVAHELVRQGAEEGTLIIAEQQTQGRGRQGRAWHSPKGKGIYMSLVLKPRIPLHFTPQLTLLVAVALCRTMSQYVGDRVGIKWPNDLLIDGRKVSGILLESRADDERLHYVVAGIGIGVNLTAEDYPPELHKVATSLRMETGVEIDRAAFICAFLAELEELYGLYHREGFAPIQALWEARSVSLGKRVTAVAATGTITGVAERIDDSGALMLRLDDGTSLPVYSGLLET
ncbi:MAG: biotin--[acetyl-CoA-carboxylase] ligase [Paenibacillaceae bacterium]|nr:biotin--[acetyl-CoA-carboxylase] ligase [Paenibacillaceae bacterium]